MEYPSTSPPNFTQNPFFEASPSQDSEVDEEAGGLKWVPSANMGKFHVKNLSPVQQKAFLQSLFKGGEDYNELFLKRIKDRMDRVGVKLPTVEVRFQNLTVEAKCYVGRRALPTLWNATRNTFEGLLNFLGLSATEKVTLPILEDISGIIEPSRMTLLLGPPGSGKTTMLLALAGRLDPNLKVKGEITYNGYSLDEFVPQKTSSYISQDDLHLGELTVRETLEFSSRCQGVGAKQDILSDIARRENSRGISPDPDIDLFMKTTATEGTSLQTNYILKMLGLDVCADTIVGDEMIRGISGGQKKRVTTGELIVGPSRTLFMDEISTGLDSSTTYKIVKFLGEFAHYVQGTIFMSLLQPSPETFELFDDIILLSEGRIVYQGPREHVLAFFENCGFKCPARKGAADFLQEVISRKDQEQYWIHRSKDYQYISANDFAERFQQFHVGESWAARMSIPSDKATTHQASLVFTKDSVKKIELLKACLGREALLIKRNMFVFVFRVFQIVIMALITMTVFLRTRMHESSLEDGSYFLGALFFSLVISMFNGISEIAFIIFRLPVFFKQRDLLFYPSWTFTLPTFLVRLPFSVIEAGIWVAMTYYVMGFAPDAGRFFRQFIVIFLVHQMSSSLFRLIGGICRTMVVASTGGSLMLLVIFVLGGFILPKDQIPKWWVWGYWVSPLTYAENAIAVNEMLAPRWRKPTSSGTTLGIEVLNYHGIFTRGYWYWIGVAALLGFSIFFNVLLTIVLAYINPPGKAQVVISKERLSELKQKHANSQNKHVDEPLPNSVVINTGERIANVEMQYRGDKVSSEIHSGDLTIKDPSQSRGMTLPFQPLTISFEDINYSVDLPAVARGHGDTKTKLQLLHNVTGAFRPGVLTALMGVSGAGKTTLMDVLAGRKTGGYIQGDIKISGFPKRQETFARISGYCEQTDVHSPQLTVYESLVFSAWLRLSADIGQENKMAFVDEVMDLIELESLRDALVGIPGMTGLSTEQRKRLTIAVELVANPSIIFMDEPTSGLDARAAAIVMRTVRNTVDTGRTVVCTIHQPSIDIFEAFDELLLLKQGGRTIYAGPLGDFSIKVVDYFEAIPGVPKIRDGFNPATWMLEVTSESMEAHLGLDFAEIYLNSDAYQYNKRLVKDLSKPDPHSKDLFFATEYSLPYLKQLKCCIWKQWLTYWRSPDYNCVRFVYCIFCALIYASIFWNVGQIRRTEQDLLNVLGAMYGAVMFLGVTNCSIVQPVVAIERGVFYRERAAGMYSATPYALAQVLIEIPYTLLQTIIYGCIVYSTMNFPWSPAKFFWFLFMMFFTFLYFTYYGMLAVSITPNHQVAAIVASTFYSLFNLFSGFFVPRPRIPGWWIWYYWICPVAWTLYGIVTSQYGDVKAMIELESGNTTRIDTYLEEHLGYKHDFLGVVALVLVAFSLFFAFMYAFCIKYLNFQRR